MFEGKNKTNYINVARTANILRLNCFITFYFKSIKRIILMSYVSNLFINFFINKL